MIQWSAPALGRARSRRRFSEAGAGAPMAPILLVEDDEDDVVVSSPRAHAQAKNRARVDAHRFTRATRGLAAEDSFELRVEIHRSTRPARGLQATLDDFMDVNRRRAAREASVEEVLEAVARAPAVDLSGIPLDPSEWRLGPGVEGNATGRRGQSATGTTIDLTTAPACRSAPPNEDCVVLLEYTKNPRKRKPVPVPEDPVLVREVVPEPTPAPPPPPPAAEDYRFKCAICMENLKDETSTICGHIFCGACIKGAVQAHKKCPTCRKKLNMKNIHRIYL